MAFKFKSREPFQKGVRRIGLEQIDRAIARLSGGADPVGDIHDSRKCFKRVRALLRLVRPGLGEAAFEHENARFRDIGRLLSGTRDRHVLLQTIVLLQAELRPPQAALAALTRAMTEAGSGDFAGEHPVGGAAEIAAELPVEAALAGLREARKRFARLTLEPDGPAMIALGLERSYRKARRAFAAAYAEPGDEAFHEWRKGVQQHWRHMTLLSAAWPDCLAVRARTAKALSTLLGEDHDFAVLAAFVRGLPRDQLSAADVEALLTACSAAQATRRAEAKLIGARLFAETPRRHVGRMMDYWAIALLERDLAKEMPRFAAETASEAATGDEATARIAATAAASADEPAPQAHAEADSGATAGPGKSAKASRRPAGKSRAKGTVGPSPARFGSARPSSAGPSSAGPNRARPGRGTKDTGEET